MENFPGFTPLGILDEVQNMISVNLSTSKEGSSSCRCTIDIDWTRRGNKEYLIANAHRVAEYARRFTQGHWSFLGPGSEKKFYRTHAHKLDGEWEKTAEGMMLNFAESGHLVFHATSAEERGELKRKGKGVKFIHFNRSDDTIELILRTVIVLSVNQQSVCGAVAGLCRALARDTLGTGKPSATVNLESMVICCGYAFVYRCLAMFGMTSACIPLPGSLVATRLGVQHHWCSHCVSRSFARACS